MSKFLYGAAVQGIQDFIFRTNKLQEIVGASELVESICTTAFNEFEAKNGESIVRAAGNIKYIFYDENSCKKTVREFPKKVMTMAPGITISQAVVPYEDGKFEDAVNELEARLKTQRNKVPQSVTTGLMGIKRANNTGLPVTFVERDKKGIITRYLDDATKAKLGKTAEYEKTEEKEQGTIDPKLRVWDLCEKSFGIPVRRRNIAYEISDITGKNDWIAIIHADGNGFGKVIQKVGKDKDQFKVFSKTLDMATRNAARTAFRELLNKGRINTAEVIPIRPVVLDGDDMTAIIRGDLAIEYAEEFIKAFENETGKDMSKEETGQVLGKILKEYAVFENGKNYLTACAGIAFIKSSYPFYYGYQLAEELCGQAKKDTKSLVGENDLPQSCFMFHKVQDSFITRYEDIVVRELTTSDGLSFKAGPYYLANTPNKHTGTELKELSNLLDNEHGDGIKSGVRQWISARLKDKSYAYQRKKRMLQVFKSDDSIVESLTEEREMTCIAYDVLIYHTIMNQQTNDK